MKSVLVLIALGLCLACGSAAGAPQVRKTNSVERIVRFDYPVTNRADQTQDIRICLPLPQSNVRQDVLLVYPEPGHDEIVADAYGNRIAIYREKAVKPGHVRRRGWIAAVRTFAAVFEPSSGVPALSEAERELYLRDSPKYQLESPTIAAVSASICRPGISDDEKAISVFNYLVENVKYLRDDKWDTAPEVLEKKQGSCSEYTYATIALLRRCGLPCRYTGGAILSARSRSGYDAKVHEDAVFHRWTEVYLRQYGWFPMDGSRGYGSIRRLGNTMNFWGRLNADSLQTYCGDGGDDNYVEWDYVGGARGSVEDTLRVSAVFFWIDLPAENLQPAIDAVNRALAEKLPAESLASIARDTLQREILLLRLNDIDPVRWPGVGEELYRARHPAAVYLSIHCDYLGVPMPSFLAFPLLVDEYFRSEILKHRRGGTWNWSAFEHWWRKARPEVSFSEEKTIFVLPRREIDLN